MQFKIQNTAMQFKKFPGNNAPNPRFREEESLFSFSKNVPKLSNSNAEFRTNSGGRTPGPPFWEGEVKVASCWNYVWLRICQPSTIKQQRYNMQNNQLEKSKSYSSNQIKLDKGGTFYFRPRRHFASLRHCIHTAGDKRGHMKNVYDLDF